MTTVTVKATELYGLLLDLKAMTEVIQDAEIRQGLDPLLWPSMDRLESAASDMYARLKEISYRVEVPL